MKFQTVFCLMALLVTIGCETSTRPVADPPKSSTATTQSIQLEIDFRGRKPNLKLEISASSAKTVLEVLEAASASDNLKYESTGSGETAFVTSIEGVPNEGAAGDNWIFYVDDQLGDQGSGVYPVKSGARVTWALGKYP